MLIELMKGKKLIPRTDGTIWRFDITPSQPRFRRKRGRDETLDGAMTEYMEHHTQTGALSLDSDALSQDN